MKLDINCVRDVLLCLEESLVLDDDLTCNSFSVEMFYNQCNLETYTIAEVGYTLVKLEEAGYINASFKWLNRQIYCSDIYSITFAGHQFLDTIRPASTWEKNMRSFQENRCKIFCCNCKNCRNLSSRTHFICTK